MLAEKVEEKIVLAGDPRDRTKIKSIPGARFGAKTKQWTIPLTWTHCLMLRSVFGEGLEIGPELHYWAMRERLGIRHILTARDTAMAVQDFPGRPDFYSHQNSAVAYLELAGNVILADEMGTGKTATVIETIDGAGQYPALIVAPKSVVGSWVAEYAKWAPHVRVQPVVGGAQKRRKALEAEADVYVVGWGSVRLHSRLAGYGSTKLKDGEKEEKELNRPWAVVVADEAHRMKDPKAKQTRALWAIGDGAERRIAMTGTPIANHPGDFWSLLRFIEPTAWPSKVKYVDLFCETAWNAWGAVDVTGLKPSMKRTFFEAVDRHFLRRQKELVLKDLPDKVYMTRVVELTPKQRKAYRELKEEMVAELDSEDLVVTDQLVVLGRLVALASSMLDSNEEDGVFPVEPSNKLDALEEILVDIGDEPAVVFATSRKLIDLTEERLERHKISCTRVTGAESDEQRWRNIEDFQAGRARVILCTVGAGGEGITLTKSRNVIFLQRPWSLVQSLQAEDRIHRPGAEVHDFLRVIDIVSEGTIDEDVVDKLVVKGERLEELTRDKETLERILNATF